MGALVAGAQSKEVAEGNGGEKRRNEEEEGFK